MGPWESWAVDARRRFCRGALIANEPARSFSASSNLGEPHETQGCRQPAWRRGGVVARGRSDAATAAAGDWLSYCQSTRRRGALAAAVDNRLFFAGEACSQHDYSTAHGAYLTGVVAAEQVIAVRRAKRSR